MLENNCKPCPFKIPELTEEEKIAEKWFHQLKNKASSEGFHNPFDNKIIKDYMIASFLAGRKTK